MYIICSIFANRSSLPCLLSNCWCRYRTRTEAHAEASVQADAESDVEAVTGAELDALVEIGAETDNEIAETEAGAEVDRASVLMQCATFILLNSRNSISSLRREGGRWSEKAEQLVVFSIFFLSFNYG